MNDILTFFVWFGAIVLVLFSVGIMIFFSIILYQQANAYSYEECINEFLDPNFCEVLIPPIPYQSVNWTIPFP